MTILILIFKYVCYFKGSSAITLYFNGNAVAILRKPEFYYQRKEERCSRQFGTNNKNQPYVKVIGFFCICI